MNRKHASGKDGQPPPDPLTLHAMGIDAFRAGQLEMAADLITQAIAVEDQMPAFHYNLGIVQKARGKLEQAAASYQRAIALKPDYPDAHNNLGNVWKELGKPDEARACFEQALRQRPGNADTHYNLGLLCRDAGDSVSAARHFRQCLEQDPNDSRGVRILLAHLGVGDAPEQTSQSQLQKIYDVRARFWDREDYFGHTLVAEALRQHLRSPQPDILDLGCGTGLVGTLVRGAARRLDGVDVSSGMLEQARAKAVYDRLEQADILAFLATHPARYDAILAAATLIHFGDLRAVFLAAAASLRASGLLVFTLFPHAGADFAVAASARLAQSGCYAHSAQYIERLAPECGFSVLALNQAIHEHDQDGNPVPGLVVALCKGGRGSPA
jgi:predicted TPR repeat methyltransferase